MRPKIFISAVTRELGPVRQLAANALTRLGYDPVWQDVFDTESGDLRQVLQAKIDESQGVVHMRGSLTVLNRPRSILSLGGCRTLNLN